MARQTNRSDVLPTSHRHRVASFQPCQTGYPRTWLCRTRLQHDMVWTLLRGHGVKPDSEPPDSLAITNRQHEHGPGVRFQDSERHIITPAERVGVCYVSSIAVSACFPSRLSPSQTRHLHDDSALYPVQQTTHEANLRYIRADNLATSTPHDQTLVLATWQELVLIAQERVANTTSGSPLVVYICTKHSIGPNLAVFRGPRRSSA